MIEIQPITHENAALFKEIRLKALKDSPFAFSSTYERESQFPDDEWTRRIERWSGKTGIGYLAMDANLACGIAGALLDSEEPIHIHLVSMWTAPTHRNQGVGQLLVGQVLRWAALKNAPGLYLMVTANNIPAIRFYERLGFTRTGRTIPFPNDPAIIEYEMVRPIP